jgi:hypothetical protein
MGPLSPSSDKHAGERVVSHDSKSAESCKLTGSIRRCDQAILEPLEEANGSWFCQQKVYSKIHETFLEPIHHHSGGAMESLSINGFGCNLFIKIPHIGKKQMIQIPRWPVQMTNMTAVITGREGRALVKIENWRELGGHRWSNAIKLPL